MCNWNNSDSDGPSFCKWSTRRARKEHRCCECGGAIRSGETYNYLGGVWEGYWDSYKFCTPCHAVIKEFASAHEHNYPLIGALDEALSECVAEETIINDDDSETVSEIGKKWQAALDGMVERREAIKRTQIQNGR